jgi:hypothetical protein
VLLTLLLPAEVTPGGARFANARLTVHVRLAAVASLPVLPAGLTTAATTGPAPGGPRAGTTDTGPRAAAAPANAGPRASTGPDTGTTAVSEAAGSRAGIT